MGRSRWSELTVVGGIVGGRLEGGGLVVEGVGFITPVEVEGGGGVEEGEGWLEIEGTTTGWMPASQARQRYAGCGRP